MNKKILFLVLTIAVLLPVATAGLFDFLKEEQTEVSTRDVLAELNISKDFNTKVTELDTTKLCVKDQTKLVKRKNCELKKPKTKYTVINVSNSDLFTENSQGAIKIR